MSVTGCVYYLERLLAEMNLFAVLDSDIDIRGIGGAMHNDLDTVALTHELAGRVVIRVGMGIDDIEHLGAEEFDQAGVVVGLVDLWVDDDTKFVLGAAEHVGEAAAGTNLFKDGVVAAHGIIALPLSGSRKNTRRDAGVANSAKKAMHSFYNSLRT